MLRGTYDASGSGAVNTFHVTRKVGSAHEVEAWLRATPESRVIRVLLLVKRHQRGDVRTRVQGRDVLGLGQLDAESWRVESAVLHDDLPRAVLWLQRVPFGVFE